MIELPVSRPPACIVMGVPGTAVPLHAAETADLAAAAGAGATKKLPATNPLAAMQLIFRKRGCRIKKMARESPRADNVNTSPESAKQVGPGTF